MNLFLPKDDKTTLSVATAILKNFNVKTPHTPCKYLKKIDVNKKNVVLIVVDGFGYNLYKKHYIKSYLHDYLVAKIYSTYPTTTSSSYVSLATGLSVKEHALTGWNIWLKEIGTYVLGLPYRTIFWDYLNYESFSKVFDIKSRYDSLKIDKYALDFEEHKSGLSINMFEQFTKFGFRDNDDFFNKLNIILRKKDKKYVFAYYPFIDVYSHKFGPYSDEVKLDLDKFILNLRKLLAIKDTLIILTADHGQTPVSKTLQINYNDEIMNYLELPPTGDSRFLYFYVKHNCKKEFVDLVKDKYSNFFEIYETRSLYPIFGKGPENIKFKERIGNYIGLAKPHCAIKYKILDKVESPKKGSHSGATRDELEVPLFVFEN